MLYIFKIKKKRPLDYYIPSHSKTKSTIGEKRDVDESKRTMREKILTLLQPPELLTDF